MIGVLVDVAGWAGAGLLLAAYALASTGRVPAEGVSFQTLNLVGAAALILNSSYHGAWPSAILNIAWIGIGLAALVRRRRLRTRRRVGAPAK